MSKAHPVWVSYDAVRRAIRILRRWPTAADFWAIVNRAPVDDGDLELLAVDSGTSGPEAVITIALTD